MSSYHPLSSSQAGPEVIATASPRKFDFVRSLGATQVIDYKDAQAISKLCDLGPYDFIMSTSGDAPAANTISDILQPTGGVFAATRPKSDEMNLAANVELVYDAFNMVTQKPENEEFSRWFYGYLSGGLAAGLRLRV
ncbi:hypothetical protein BDW59DRAFT_159120 [Aspergillus cavernicola]|uniref:Alcohol dehydrogenase-like C-terminal domain-containing protein n=1 Tax=Aspergillus cavernicola TaxID=176166 RepID=A0ABR4IPK9_9EURO